MTGSREGRRELLALVGLWTAGVSWPLLSALSDDGAALVARQPSPGALLLLAVSVTLLAPVALAGLLALARGAGGAASGALRPTLVCALLAAALLHLASRGLPRDEGLSGDVLVVLSALLAGGLSAAWLRWPALRSLFGLGSPAALLVLGGFLLDDDVRPMLGGWRDAPAAAPVIVVVFDELPLDSLLQSDERIDPRLFPHLAGLADEGILFLNASTVHEDSSLAMEALLSGSRRRDDAGDGPAATDLFSLLGATHRPVAWGGDVRRVCPPALLAGHGATPGKLASDALAAWTRAVLPPPFDAVAPASPGHWRAPPPGTPPATSTGRAPAPNPGLDRSGSFREWIARIDGSGPPPVAVIHSALPGRPWRLLPDGTRYATLPRIDGLVDGQWSDEPWPSAQALQRHLLQLGWADRLVGELLAQLAATGLGTRATVIVTASGGADFQPGGHLDQPSVTSAREVLGVPLLLRAPSLAARAGEASSRNVELVDVLPTLAELLGRPLDTAWQGTSLLAGAEVEARPFKNAGRRSGPPVVLSGDAPGVRPALRRKSALFGPQPDWDAIEALSPVPGLVGATVDELGVAGLHPATAQVHSVVGAAGELPCLLVGTVLASDSSQLPPLVVACLDDRVVAATRTRTRRGHQVAFEMLLPAGPLRAGHTRLSLYARNADGGLLALDVVDWTQRRDEHDRVVGLASSNGRELSVLPSAFGAFLDSAERTADGVRLRGWAGDRLTSRAADTLLVFVGDRFVHADTTGVARPELPGALGDPALAGAGFDFEVPADRLGDDFASRTHVFAVVDDLATELVSNRDGRWLTELTWRLDGATLAAPDGRRLALGDPDLWGTLELAEVRADRLRFSGWAVDVSGPSAVDELIVLVDGESVASLVPGGAEHRVAPLLGGREVERAGFGGELPLSWFGGEPDGRLLIVARVGERAVRLRASPEASWAVPGLAAPADDDG